MSISVCETHGVEGCDAISCRPLMRMPLALQVASAATPAERAAIVLQLPDAAIVTHGQDLLRACHDAGFGMGSSYLAVRLASLHCVRGSNGMLPADRASVLDDLRADLVTIAEAGI